jgi:hypothetical protein
MDINRNYEKLKLVRTYIGGSKKKELQIFLKSQGINDDEVYTDSCIIDWLEFRKLVVTRFEDIICVNYSRRFYAEKLAYLFLSMGVVLYRFKTLSLISISIAVFFYALFKHYKRTEGRNILNYNAAIRITNGMIRQELGLEFSGIE